MTNPERDQLDSGPTYGIGEEHTSYGRRSFPGTGQQPGVTDGERNSSAPDHDEAEVEHEDG